MAFYNTIYFRGEDLKQAWEATSNQESLILYVFKTNSTKSFSPSDLYQFFTEQGYKWPLTSIRRAITDLTKDKELIQLDKQKPGMYGKPEGLWQYKQLPPPVTGSLFE